MKNRIAYLKYAQVAVSAATIATARRCECESVASECTGLGVERSVRRGLGGSFDVDGESKIGLIPWLYGTM